MSYIQIEKTNYWYAIRQNLKEFLIERIPIKVTIESVEPDITSLVHAKHLPYIVLPESDVPNDTTFLSGDAAFNFTIEGTMYHDYAKLGDNSLRLIKQTLLSLKTKDMRKYLAKYGMQDFDVSIEPMDTTKEVINQKEFIAIDFTIVTKAVVAIEQ